MPGDSGGSRTPGKGQAPRLRRALLRAGGLAAGLLLVPVAVPAASAGLSGSTSSYVVGDSTVAAATSAVTSVGGQVTEPLAAADAVLAQLTPTEVSLLQGDAGVTVTPDVTVSVQDFNGSTTDPPHTPSDAFLSQTGAPQVWNQGDQGANVTVAVLDTGIDALPDFAGRLVGGVDLSGEGNPFHDSFGHGTFDAGLIAGDGASSAGAYSGEAPGAGLVSVKVAGASGQTDLATVILGVGWAIANHQALHIGVLNMSLGYQPLESTAVDPLDVAVENAWSSGIVVVVSSGNAGPFNGTVESPGDDPLVVTVGSLDDLAQKQVAKDVMTTFSSVGPTNPDGWLKPDLVTSGRSVVSLLAPGSTIATQYPSAQVGSAGFMGSGTSFSAAITSGAAALILAAHPGYSPEQVKAALLSSTVPGPVGNPVVDGHGALSAVGAVGQVPLDLTQTPSLVAVPMGCLVGLSSTWAASSWNPANWSSMAWNGESWNGESWNGESWNGESWNGESWNGSAWD